MVLSEEIVRLVGSEYQPLDAATLAGPDTGADPIRVAVVLRGRKPLPPLTDGRTGAELGARPLRQVDDDFAADPHDVERVKAFAHDNDLREIGDANANRTIELEGTAAALSHAFHTRLVRFEHPRGNHRGHTGAIYIPQNLGGIVTHVIGLHDRPRAHPKPPPIQIGEGGHAMVHATDLAACYGFPPGTGRGQRIGIIELGGGFRREDLETFFAPGPVPKITQVSVGAAANRPEPAAQVGALMRWMRGIADGSANPSPPPSGGKSTVEVTMDIELAGILAPDSEIIVYFAENTDLGLMDALQHALDPAGLRPSVLSLSWSWNECGDAFEAHINDLLLQAAHSNVTFCAATGDFGARGGPSSSDDAFEPQFPATSPYALACGGTTLTCLDGQRRSEVVWRTEIGMASGGGISKTFALPAWQIHHGVPTSSDGVSRRGIPDVAANADPTTHCRIYAGGQWGPAAGTSAVAPLWAALVARINESLGAPVGYLNPHLYRFAARGRPVVYDVLEGNNGTYHARQGWDACTGLGTPRGVDLLAALRGE